MTKIARVLTIAGSDSGGGAGIQADLKTITVLGGYGMSAITALTAQNTVGVRAVHPVPPDFVAAQIDAVLSDIGADAAKTGMLATPEIVVVVANAIERHQMKKVVVDPVMVAKSGDALLSPEGEAALLDLIVPLACVLTPNIPEAERLTGQKIEEPEQMEEAAAALREKGARCVLVKGGHLRQSATDVLFDGNEFHHFDAERIATKNTHGTGCTYSAAIATGLAQGLDVFEAVNQAKTFVTKAIRRSLALGRGSGPLNHAAAQGYFASQRQA
ncbi:MAG: bifunctional hydroxymethylpyrimidine kinase/phosphomethylpyrimidine kinase [Planctomycetes bacterium]|nr:bifunctional hydroxymethylpyrimidine kinase/phosphomethylpyrimidine kinase [Planctomycetota bacterium]